MLLPHGVIFSIILTVVWGFRNPYPRCECYEIEGDAGKPLILTPYIEARKTKEARFASAICHKELTTGITSYSGYFTVNKQFHSNIFFWFFENRNVEAPVLLWLQGGPGASSLFGLFEENGPFIVRQDRIKFRTFAWTRTHSMLYMDSPVGTGYSFTSGGYARNETTIGKNLYEALLQFFTVFSEYQGNAFYISGESYAGKYIPALAYTIHTNNPSAKIKINLQGLAIGNGWTDPINQYQYSEYLYQIGLLDRHDATIFKRVEDDALVYIKTGQWKKAYDTFHNLLDDDFSLFKNITGFKSYYNLLFAGNFSIAAETFARFVQRPDIRHAIHVGNTSFGLNETEVEENLAEDFYQSAAQWLAELLSYYRVLVYSGQLDIIVPYPLTENYLSKLNFTGADVYRNAKRHQWKVGSELAGYIKYAGNLTEVLVRNAGHMVPKDQPVVALDLITRFTHGKPFL